MATVLIGLGSNRGDRRETIRRAVQAIAGFGQKIQCSALYESPALLPPDAPKEWNSAFLNAVAVMHTGLDPLALLEHLKQLERQLGRQKIGHWAPREIDLDILAYDDRIWAEDGLMIPHPEMLKRDFVLVPLAEVSGSWRYPVAGEYQGMTGAELVIVCGFERHSLQRVGEVEAV